MSDLMSRYHVLTGNELPVQWLRLTMSERISVCTYLRMKASSSTIYDFKRGRKIWLEDIDPRTRNMIRSHLQAIGELDIRHVPYTTFREHGQSQVQAMVAEAYRKASQAVDTYRQNNPAPIKIWLDEASHFKQPSMLYERPNGGQRTLPSAYGRLNGHLWLRANGVMQPIKTMNDGHLENTLKLLQESHGNIISKSTSLLGKMHRHFQHQPEIQSRLEELCLLMQKVEVHEMYPIFGTLAQEQASRTKYGIVAGVDFSSFDDALKDW